MPTLRYRNPVYVDATNTTQFAQLTEALRKAVVANEIQMETTELRFDPENDTIRAGVGARIEFDESTTTTKAIDRFAQILVDNGVDKDLDEAKKSIHVAGPNAPNISRSQVGSLTEEPSDPTTEDPTTDTQTVQLQGPKGIQVSRKPTDKDGILFQVTENGEPTPKALVEVTSDAEYAGVGTHKPTGQGEVTLPEPSKDVEITITATEG